MGALNHIHILLQKTDYLTCLNIFKLLKNLNLSIFKNQIINIHIYFQKQNNDEF